MGRLSAEIINPFIAAATHVFKTVLSQDLHRGRIYFCDADQQSDGICAMVELSGSAVGAMALVVSVEVGIGSTEQFLGATVPRMNEDVVDCLAELSRMIAVSARLRSERCRFHVSSPTVTFGAGQTPIWPNSVTPICVPFRCETGDVLLQLALDVQETP